MKVDNYTYLKYSSMLFYPFFFTVSRKSDTENHYTCHVILFIGALPSFEYVHGNMCVFLLLLKSTTILNGTQN